MKVAIVDDDPLVRMGLRAIVGSEDGWDVVGEAGDGVDAVALAEREQPDIMLMDVRMPGMDGLTATREIIARGLGTRVLVLTTFEVDEYVFDAMRSGASGFVLKRIPPADLIESIRVVALGESLLFPSSTRAVIERFASRGLHRLPELTEREEDVLRALARGRSNGEIAADLFVSVETVKSHVASILMKLGVRDRTQAVIAAYESGFVAPGEDAEA
ncbi:response regulator transcription factor [Demequina mangrovi]|uniref:Two component transcriptional regulator, LuxR family n=1 Tax=Demequina mangrovi TaxID=1043493 RepID=A0A1H6WMX5_9MICO|nr:response regulator transcription factor [Demequina mangrovi]SEJ18248.1 two component transcriptional regulator, LuxR family [Demequina mangrovi]